MYIVQPKRPHPPRHAAPSPPRGRLGERTFCVYHPSSNSKHQAFPTTPGLRATKLWYDCHWQSFVILIRCAEHHPLQAWRGEGILPRQPVPSNRGVATAVCALARNDSGPPHALRRQLPSRGAEFYKSLFAEFRILVHKIFTHAVVPQPKQNDCMSYNFMFMNTSQ